ncbi:MAG: dihydrofolate reductase [Candidatus Azotimanducaceae bacterium]|jgi:dihydrofolate reductase
MIVQLIAARANNNVIGAGSNIPWQAKGEQKLFREITTGGVLIMGRKTYESIGKPLPGRVTIIVTRNPHYSASGCKIATNLALAIEMAQSEEKPIFIAGGGDLYTQALAFADEIHLTTIDVEPEGDVYFPVIDPSDYEILHEQRFETNVKYIYQHLKRL